MTNNLSNLDTYPTELLWWNMFMAVIKQIDSKDYGRTSYISCPATIPLPPDHGRTSYISPPTTTPPWLRKDNLHFPSCYPPPDYISHPDKTDSPLLQHLWAKFGPLTLVSEYSVSPCPLCWVTLVYIFVRYCQLHCYVTVKSVYIGGMQVNSIQELKHQTPL